MLKIKKKAFIILLVIVFAGGSLAGAFGINLIDSARDIVRVDGKDYKAMTSFIDRYKDLFKVNYCLEQGFLYGVDGDKIAEAAARSAVEALGDEYTSYMNEKEWKEWTDHLSGVYYGIGIYYSRIDGKFIIGSVMKNSPAEEAGLMKDDIILKVDGKEYSDSDKMNMAIRGDVGTSVELTYSRNGSINTVSVTRAKIENDSIYSEILDGNIGYISINSFDENTGDLFKTELTEMEKAQVKGLIIDLRNNGGGYVTSAINIADELLPACNIVTAKDKKGTSKKYNSAASATKLKYVLLVNEYSASASEILAGAIKDNDGGKLIGTKTYGKGVIQTSEVLPTGGALKYTIMEYLTPKGNKVHKLGIKPDYVIEDDRNTLADEQLNKAIQVLVEELK
ncbi:MAG: S41 family peptidase [Clostridia bacterium]|nr:S41 family peptidase [Clostridia bacterium]